MRRRAFLAGTAGLSGSFVAGAVSPNAARELRVTTGAADRSFMLGLLDRMASPVLTRMSRAQLQRGWSPELSPTWDGRNPKVAYMEAFGRLIDGIAPWLSLPDTDDAEGRLRVRLRGDAQASFAHAVDPASPDYLLWRGHGQALVDSAYVTSAILRAPDALWKPLGKRTQDRLIQEVQLLRHVAPPYTNWILFAAMNEAFLLWAGAQWDPVRLDLTVRKFEEWYVGDGWYSDGPRFHFDYYNSYVIHPMLTQILEVIVATGATFNALNPSDRLARQYQRLQRYGAELERMIGPDGSYPATGRSLTYRTAVHQPLGLLAWRNRLPDTLPVGQVRAATLAAQRRIFADPTNFNAGGFLTIGFARHQPTLGDIYSNAGSMYIASESLLALGLPATDSYWTAPAEPWTMRRAYAGEDFRKDYYVDF